MTRTNVNNAQRGGTTGVNGGPEAGQSGYGHSVYDLRTFFEHGLKWVRWRLQGDIKILCQAFQVVRHIREFVWNQSRGLVACHER